VGIMKKILVLLINILFFCGYGQLTISSPNEVEEGKNYQIQVTLDEPLEHDLYLFFEIEHLNTSSDDFKINNDLMTSTHSVYQDNDPFSDEQTRGLGIHGDTIYYHNKKNGLWKFNLSSGVPENIYNSSVSYFDPFKYDIVFWGEYFYISNNSTNRIEKWDLNYNLIEEINTPQPDGYIDFTIDDNGNLFVVQYERDRILKYSNSSWSVFLENDNDGYKIFESIKDIRFDFENNDFVISDSNLGLSIWSKSGELIEQFNPSTNDPPEISFLNDELVLSVGGSNTGGEHIVYKTKLSYLRNNCYDYYLYYNNSNIIMGELNNFGSTTNKLHDPSGVEIDSNGVVYVIDGQNERIQYKFTQPTIKIPSGELVGTLDLMINSDSKIEGDENFTLKLKKTSLEEVNQFNWSESIKINDLSNPIVSSLNLSSNQGVEGQSLDLSFNIVSSEQIIIENIFSGDSSQDEDFEITNSPDFEVIDLSNSLLSKNRFGDVRNFKRGCIRGNDLILIGSSSSQLFNYNLITKDFTNLLDCYDYTGLINDVVILGDSLYFITDYKIFGYNLNSDILTVLFDNSEGRNQGENYMGIDIFENILYLSVRNPSGNFKGITKYNIENGDIEYINLPFDFPKDIQVTENFIYILERTKILKYDKSYQLLSQTSIPGNGGSRGFYISQNENYVFITKLSYQGQDISFLYKVNLSNGNYEMIYDETQRTDGRGKMYGIIPSHNDNFYFTSSSRLYKYLESNFIKTNVNTNDYNITISLNEDNIEEGDEVNSIQTLYHSGDVIVDGGKINFTIQGNSLSLSKNNKPSFSVYPNPTKEILNIDIDDYKSSELFNISGQSILKTDEKSLDLSKFNRGVYFLTIETINGIKSKGMKVLKE
jgi:hypothetical protein